MSETKQLFVSLALAVLGLAISGWMCRHFVTLFTLLLVVSGCGITPEHTGGVGWR